MVRHYLFRFRHELNKMRSKHIIDEREEDREKVYCAELKSDVSAKTLRSEVRSEVNAVGCIGYAHCADSND